MFKSFLVYSFLLEVCRGGCELRWVLDIGLIGIFICSFLKLGNLVVYRRFCINMKVNEWIEIEEINLLFMIYFL